MRGAKGTDLYFRKMNLIVIIVSACKYTVSCPQVLEMVNNIAMLLVKSHIYTQWAKTGLAESLLRVRIAPRKTKLHYKQIDHNNIARAWFLNPDTIGILGE